MVEKMTKRELLDSLSSCNNAFPVCNDCGEKVFAVYSRNMVKNKLPPQDCVSENQNGEEVFICSDRENEEKVGKCHTIKFTTCSVEEMHDKVAQTMFNQCLRNYPQFVQQMNQEALKSGISLDSHPSRDEDVYFKTVQFVVKFFKQNRF